MSKKKEIKLPNKNAILNSFKKIFKLDSFDNSPNDNDVIITEATWLAVFPPVAVIRGIKIVKREWRSKKIL